MATLGDRFRSFAEESTSAFTVVSFSVRPKLHLLVLWSYAIVKVLLLLLTTRRRSGTKSTSTAWNSPCKYAWQPKGNNKNLS